MFFAFRALIELLLIKCARDDYDKRFSSKILSNEKNKSNMVKVETSVRNDEKFFFQCIRRYRLSSVMRRVCEFDAVNSEEVKICFLYSKSEEISALK